MEGFARDLLRGIGKGDEPTPEKRPGQPLEETEEVELSLGLSLGGRFGVDRKGDKLPQSSSVAAMLTPPMDALAPLALPRTSSSQPVQAVSPEVPASGIPASSDRHKLQGTFTRTSSSLKRLEVKMKRTAFKGTPVTKEQSTSSSVPSPGEAMSSMTAASPRMPSMSLAPRTATLGSRGHESITGWADARANSTRDVERRLMQEMPSVFTKGLPNGKRVDGFLYKYKKAEDVKIVCICHGNFLTPSEFVEHAGAGKVDNPQRHIVVSPTPTL